MAYVVYVLELEHGKKYVGQTSNWLRRLEEHYSPDRGAQFTRLYHPLPPDFQTQLIPCSSQEEANIREEYVTVELMATHGIDNVRGGQYSQVDLPPQTIEHIQRSIDQRKGNCFICHQSGHGVMECPKAAASGAPSAQMPLHSPRNPSSHSSGTACHRCGRLGHWVDDCYAKSTVDGMPLPPHNECQRCRRPGHRQDECYARTSVDGRALPSVCHRCGRPGHWANECYAKSTVDGNRL
eukprot:m.158420 g.158420  ORF g.158420 m.158420 type:complete len:238 (+) comp38738_c0_seq2:433-1146(+)